MAKIVFISISNVNWTKKLVSDGFIESFAKVLSRNGNIVYNIVVNRLDIKKVHKLILKTAPDLIFAFNNVGIHEKFFKVLNCKFILFGSDSVAFWESLDFLRLYPDRYYILNHSYDTYSQILDLFREFPKAHNIIFGHATDIKRLDVAQDIKISFVGSLGNWDKSIVKYFQKMYELCENFPKEYFYNLNDLKQQFLKDQNHLKDMPLSYDTVELPMWGMINKNISFKQSLILNLTCQRRFKILKQFINLNLKIFSCPQGMVDVLTYDHELFSCFDFKNSVSFEDNQLTFNRSLLSLNLPHGHAVNGFSWRVCDIMASQACLLSEKRPDLLNLMKPYMNNFPMFESDAEAKDLAIKLLIEENWRKDIVNASNQMVNDLCRFEKKIALLESLVGIKLIDNNEGKYYEIG